MFPIRKFSSIILIYIDKINDSSGTSMYTIFSHRTNTDLERVEMALKHFSTSKTKLTNPSSQNLVSILSSLIYKKLFQGSGDTASHKNFFTSV